MSDTDNAAKFSAQFGGYRLRDDKLTGPPGSTSIVGATAAWTYEPSNKGPDVGRAILGIIGGGILGALLGFVILGGGVITMAVCALVIGLVSGLKPVEHAKAHVTVTSNRGSVTIEGPVTDWQAAQHMAGQIIEAAAHYAGDADRP